MKAGGELQGTGRGMVGWGGGTWQQEFEDDQMYQMHTRNVIMRPIILYNQ